MKLFAAAAFLALTALTLNAQFLFPSNPPPSIQLGWTLTSNTTYAVYYGVGHQQYTNKIPVGETNFAAVTLPGRGVTYYFAATATVGGLESGFSSEVTYTPAMPPPPPPGMLNPIVLTAQYKPTAASPKWLSAGVDWTIDPTATNAIFRFLISRK